MEWVPNLCASLVIWCGRFDFYRAFRWTANLRGPRSLPRHLRLRNYAFLGTLIILSSAVAVDAQRSGELPMRNLVDQLARIDRDRAVDLQQIKGNNRNEVREAIVKQVVEDFRDLQSVNNKMMATAFSQPALDYKYISRMVGEIGKKATRLKSNLVLPKPEEKQEPSKASAEVSNTEQFKAELLSLDKSVMSFVNNPIFQTGVIDLRLVRQANSDLEAVIDMTSKLKKASDKLKH
jgi:hypothetical protein